MQMMHRVMQMQFESYFFERKKIMLNSIEDDVLVVKFMTMQIPLHIHGENGISLFFETVSSWKKFMHGIQYFMWCIHLRLCIIYFVLNFDEALELSRNIE